MFTRPAVGRAAMTTWLLLPSPLLGPGSWEPAADLLRRAGEHVTVASAHGATSPADVLASYIAAARTLEAPVLVPHSNAGLFAPAVAAAAGAVATVYVDAALAAPRGPTTLAPPAFMEFLVGLAGTEGTLPPWSRWWGEADLFPDEATRALVEAGEPRMPLAYFRACVDAPADWESFPQAYVAFGDTYGEETTRARSLGWPVRRLDADGRGGHLLLLHHPAVVVAGLRDVREGLR